MKQLNYSELFVNDRQIQTKSKTAILKLHNVGTLVLPTGAIVATDPLVMPELYPFAQTVEPGEYPVILSVADFGGNQRVAYAMTKFNDDPPIYWKMAVLPDEDVLALEDDQILGYGVDSGIGCFMDAEAGRILVNDEKGNNALTELIESKLEKNYVSTRSWANVCVNPENGANVVCFSSGYGDGGYASYFGFNGNDRAVCLVTDFEIFADEEIS